MVVLHAKDVAFTYGKGDVAVHALKKVTCSFHAKEIVALSGPSGSGKSTLLNLLGLIEPLQDGEIFLEDQPFSKLPEKKKNALRKSEIGFIFQQFHLLPVLTAEENVAYFLHRQNLPKEEVAQRVKETLCQVGMWEHRHKKPSALSGGQAQRIAIARALAKKPAVLIADEPTASLDQANGRAVMELFSHLAKDEGITIILTSHDPMVLSFADRILHLKDGVICS